jgi:hypothetical protein
MNLRADDLMVTLRGLLGMLPGATSLSVHGAETWALVLILTSSDEAVIALNEDLELGEVKIRNGEGRWWRRACSTRDQGRFRVVVVGPHHEGPPPQGDSDDEDHDASSRSG